MSAMTENENDTDTIRDRLATRLQDHHDGLLRETSKMPKGTSRTKLETTLKIYLNPFVEEAGIATEYSRLRGAAVTYLAMCRQHIMPLMTAERQNQLREEWAELEELVWEYEQSERQAQRTLVDSIYKVASCINRSQVALISKLEEIRCELNAISITLQPISSPQGWSAKSLALLADIDLTMTQSANLLVGSSAAKTKAVQGILDSSTNPGPDGGGQGTSSTGQTAGGAS
jgi:hypothetical protein